MSDKKDSYILTTSGKRLYPFNLTEDQIHIKDIAHVLARLPRWLGNTAHKTLSVARHSINVHNYIRNSFEDAVGREPLLPYYGLLHDASEAYFGDIPSPIKRHLPDVQKLENSILIAIFNKYGVRYNILTPSMENVDQESIVLHPVVLLADSLMGHFEGTYLINGYHNPEMHKKATEIGNKGYVGSDNNYLYDLNYKAMERSTPEKDEKDFLDLFLEYQ